MTEQKKKATTKPTTEAKSTTDKGKTRDVLRVRATRDSFRRAGIGFGKTEKVLYLDELSKDQVKAIEAETNLVAVRGTVAVDDADQGDTDDKE